MVVGGCALVVQNYMAFFSPTSINYRNVRKFFISTAQVKKMKKIKMSRKCQNDKGTIYGTMGVGH
jgi:hypothetical protein